MALCYGEHPANLADMGHAWEPSSCSQWIGRHEGRDHIKDMALDARQHTPYSTSHSGGTKCVVVILGHVQAPSDTLLPE